MNIENITTENDLRDWLRDNIHYCQGRLTLKWIEPSKYGSSVGQPDCKISKGSDEIGVELKYLLTTRNGIKWTIRPSQRRYHYMHMRNGGKSALLAYIPADNRLILIRGNKIPLRDYANHPDSGCIDGKVDTSWRINMAPGQPDRNAILLLEEYLFNRPWFWKDHEDEI
jgi:hypothetical protein